MFKTNKRIAKEIKKIYEQVETEPYIDNAIKWEIQSKLNLLCKRLSIKPAHLNKLGGGTKTF